MTKNDKPLEPVDHERCQADIKSAFTPWVMGGDVGGKWSRCTKKPTWYARETEGGSDGQKGSMSLCDDCKVECAKRLGNKVAFEPLVGWNEKFHQVYDNPDSVPRDEIERVLRDAGADAASAKAFEQLIIARWTSK